MTGLGIHGPGMHDLVLREFEIGPRAALWEDSERYGWGALWDLMYERDMAEEARAAGGTGRAWHDGLEEL